MVSVRGRILVVVPVKLSGGPQETPTNLIADPTLRCDRTSRSFSAASTLAGAAYHAIPAARAQPQCLQQSHSVTGPAPSGTLVTAASGQVLGLTDRGTSAATRGLSFTY